MTCQAASDADIREVRRLHNEMLKLYQARNRLQYFKLNQQIHSALISLSGNDSLALVHDILQSRMKRIRYIGDQTDDSWSSAVQDHEEMIDALEARDGPRPVSYTHLDVYKRQRYTLSTPAFRSPFSERRCRKQRHRLVRPRATIRYAASGLSLIHI